MPWYGDNRDNEVAAQEQSALTAIKNFVHIELQHIGMDRVSKLTKIYGKDDIRVKQAKVDAFFKAYAILGTIRYAAQVCGINSTVMSRLIRTNPQFKRRFEQAHDEFCQYLEQAAVVRALQKSDSLLMFLMKANNPTKFSERLRLEALQNAANQNNPVQIVLGEITSDEPNYAVRSLSEGSETDENASASSSETVQTES